MSLIFLTLFMPQIIFMYMIFVFYIKKELVCIKNYSVSSGMQMRQKRATGGATALS